MGRFLKGLGLFLALIGVGIVSAFAVVALLLRQVEVTVPDLSGLDLVTVNETVTQLGLQFKVDRRELHPTLPRDFVVSQTPLPGSRTKKGRQVHIVLSQGPSETQAVKLMGENFRKADIMVRQAGFSPGVLSRVTSDSVERDIVIAQDPGAGSPLQKGGAISMLISTGRKTPQYVMPKLTGKKAEEALRTMDRMGLQYRVVTRSTGSQQPGAGRVVVSQKPGPGYPVAADATVEIAVSK